MRRILFTTVFIFSLVCFPFMTEAQGDLSISGMKLGKSDSPGHFSVERVYPGSPAGMAGVMEMDILIDVDHLQINEMSPLALNNMLARRIGSGKSSVLTILGAGGKKLVWLKPQKLTKAQRETLDFYQTVESYNELSDSYWSNLNNLFEKWITGDSYGDSHSMVKASMNRDGQEIWRLKNKIGDIPIPAGVSFETMNLCSKFKNHSIGVQTLRFDATSKMMDYALEKADEGPFLEERWKKLDMSIEGADRQNRKARFYAELLLRSIEKPQQDMVTLMKK